MARLIDMVKNMNSVEMTKTEKLVEALKMLIEMAEEEALNESDVELLETFFNEIIDGEEELSEKRMSAKALMAARRYRLKNKGKLAIIARKKATCAARIEDKEGYACDSKGVPHKVDRARSKAAKLGARSR